MESLWFSYNESNLSLQCGQLFPSRAVPYQVLLRPVWVVFLPGFPQNTISRLMRMHGKSKDGAWANQQALQLKRRQSRGVATYLFLRNWSLVSRLGRSAIGPKYGKPYSISYGNNPEFLRGAVLILRRVIGRHLVQGNLVSNINYLFFFIPTYIYLLASLNFSKLTYLQLSNFCNFLEISGQVLVIRCNFNIFWPRGSSKFDPEYFLIWPFNLFGWPFIFSLLYVKGPEMFWNQGTLWSLL